MLGDQELNKNIIIESSVMVTLASLTKMGLLNLNEEAVITLAHFICDEAEVFIKSEQKKNSNIYITLSKN